MALISDTEKAAIKLAYEEFFTNFKQTITVHRKAKTAIVDIYLDQLFGYGQYSGPTHFTYTPVNQTFDALVIYQQDQNNTSDVAMLNEIRAGVLDSEVLIKVKETCKTYLSHKDVERIDIGTKSYILISEEVQVHKVLDDYFIFKLKETK
tara:strand:+ start:98 stop:547 length:450 start_codon:yes stop_codon:yes gene_type:complete